MLMECLIKRVGNTPVHLEKTVYTFTPVPDAGRKKDVPSTSQCEITSPEHIEWLLKSGQYREKTEENEPLAEEKVINLSGYQIEVHKAGSSEGYRVVNNNVKPKMYAGSDMTWRDNVTGLVPFVSEFIAWQWLKEEVEFKALEKEEDGKAEVEELRAQLIGLGVKVDMRWGLTTLQDELAKVKKGK